MAKKTPRFEYIVIDCSWSDIQQTLDGYAAEGWQLHTIFENTDHTHQLIFERHL
jgi:hypothetical protein